jgi:hypothetical protein
MNRMLPNALAALALAGCSGDPADAGPTAPAAAPQAATPAARTLTLTYFTMTG